jgi:serine/threonine-protein kinase ATR
MIPQDEMKMKVFEPIMKDIICLIEEQLTMAGGNISAVILVGGFGQSQYLKNRIREAVKKSTPVLQPGDGWAAVVKGAVLHGLGQHVNLASSPKIVSRVARGSYGTCLMTKYDPKQHDPREAYKTSIPSRSAPILTFLQLLG